MKIRCKRYLYTLILKDSDKADKIKQSLPPSKFLSLSVSLSLSEYPPTYSRKLYIHFCGCPVVARRRRKN